MGVTYEELKLFKYKILSHKKTFLHTRIEVFFGGHFLMWHQLGSILRKNNIYRQQVFKKSSKLWNDDELLPKLKAMLKSDNKISQIFFSEIFGKFFSKKKNMK